MDEKMRQKLLEISRKKQKESKVIPHLPRQQQENIFPASFSQKRIWFIQQMQPETIEYNVPVAYVLKEKISKESVIKALYQLIERHEILRTTFREEGEGKLVQVIHSSFQPSFKYLDLSQVLEKEKVINKTVKEVTNCRFDLVAGPLIHFLLIKVEEERYVFAISAHHTIIDSWSLDILKGEFDELYRAAKEGRKVELPPLSIQYGDYAAWQQQDMNQQKLEKQLNYWVDKLKDGGEVTELPIDFKRPAIRSGKGSNYSFNLTPKQTQVVKELANVNDCTVFMVMLAVFEIFLYRYTHHEYVTVGTTVASRPTPETEQLIGFFINNLTFHTHINDGLSFKEFLKVIKEETLQNYKYQDVPFEKVVEKLHVKRDLSRTAVFQVMFNYLSASGETLKIEGIESEIYPLGGSKASTDLNLFAWEESGFIHLNFEYSTDLFKEETIRRFAQHYERLIQAFVVKPFETVKNVDFLTPQEKMTTTFKENQGLLDKQLIHECFEKQAAQTPKALAAYGEGRKITYQELNEKANQLAHYLMEKGVEKGERIGLYMDRSIEMLEGMLGCMKVGAAYVPLDITYPQERVRAILQTAKVKGVLTLREHLSSYEGPEEMKPFCIDTLTRRSDLSKENPNIRLDDSNLMYILFTSGSTGTPKGVMITHANYRSYIKSFIDFMGIKEPLQFGIVTTFAADLGSTNIYGALLTGGCLHIISYECAINANALAAYFKKHPVDVMKMVPSHFEALQIAEHPEWLIPRKAIIFAGEALNKETVQKVWQHRPECKVFNNYGPTETTVSALGCQVVPQMLNSPYGIPLGRPFKNTYIYVLDQNQQPVPPGAEGELYIGGLGVSKGYLEREDLTHKCFIVDPFIEGEERRIYKTGDKVRLLPDYSVVFSGRMDRQVKLRGYRVELAAIEKVLLEHQFVKEAVVTTRKDKENNVQLSAYMTLKDKTMQLTKAEVRKYIKNQLTDYMVPSGITILETMPVTANGKIDIKALPEPDLTVSQLENQYAPPESQLQEELAALWEEVLDVKRVGIDDNFFDLGGESFKAIKLIRKIDKSLSVIDLFKFPTIRELTDRINGSRQGETGRLVRLTPLDHTTPKINYICFPFAGGSAITFQPLADTLPKGYALYGVRLPGHDYACENDRGMSIEEVIAECIQEIKEKVRGPIAIYAQCISGALGLALAYELKKENIEVKILFEAANFPSPRLPGKLSSWWGKWFPEDRWMSNKVYRETLKSLGNEDDIIDVKEQDFIIEGIRHDARAATDYFTKTCYDEDFPKLDIPICCIVGARDRSTEYYEERYHEWERYSNQVFLEVIENTGHFFQKHQPKKLSGIMAEHVINGEEERKDAFKVVEGTKKEVIKSDTLSMKLFFTIIIGQIISILGSNLSGYAMGIWLYGKTGSIGNFSAVSVCTLLPGIILAPIAGVAADRYDKRKLMIMGDLCAVFGTCFVFIMYCMGKLEVWHVCLAVVISSIGNTFQSPAFLSAIPIIVPKCYLGQANGILQFVWSGGNMLGPILGAGALYLLGMKGILLMDFITCFASVGTLLIVRFPNRSFKKREEPFTKELIGGWHYIIKRPSLVIMVIFFVVANSLMSLITVLFSPLAIAVSSQSQLGVVLAANAAGVVTGSIIMSLWGGTKRRADGMVGFMLLTSMAIILMGLRPSPLLVGIGLFLFGLSIAFVDTHWQIMIQSKVGLELQGRVFAINQMLVSVFRPLAMLLAAPLCDQLLTPFMLGNSSLSQVLKVVIGSGKSRGMGLLLILTGVVLFIWSIMGFNYKPLRRMEDYLPDAIPGAVIYEDKDKMQELMDEAIS